METDRSNRFKNAKENYDKVYCMLILVNNQPYYMKINLFFILSERPHANRTFICLPKKRYRLYYGPK